MKIYKDNAPNGTIECVIAFFGGSSNGETGERANWNQSTGVRFGIDKLIMKAGRVTNKWYFDVF